MEQNSGLYLSFLQIEFTHQLYQHDVVDSVLLPVKPGTKSNELFPCPSVDNNTDHILIMKVQPYVCGKNLFCSYAGVGP